MLASCAFASGPFSEVTSCRGDVRIYFAIECPKWTGHLPTSAIVTSRSVLPPGKSDIVSLATHIG